MQIGQDLWCFQIHLELDIQCMQCHGKYQHIQSCTFHYAHSIMHIPSYSYIIDHNRNLINNDATCASSCIWLASSAPCMLMDFTLCSLHNDVAICFQLITTVPALQQPIHYVSVQNLMFKNVEAQHEVASGCMRWLVAA